MKFINWGWDTYILFNYFINCVLLFSGKKGSTFFTVIRLDDKVCQSARIVPTKKTKKNKKNQKKKSKIKET